MLYFAIILSFLIIIFNTIIRKDPFLSPVSLFPFLWIIILSLYKSGLIVLYQISNRLEIIITLGILGFFLGGELSNLLYPVKNKMAISFILHNNTDAISYDTKKRNTILFVLSLLCIVLLTIRVIPSISLLRLGYTFNQITVEKLYYKAENGIMLFLSVYFMEPFSTVLSVIGAYELLKGRGDVRLIICSIIVVVLCALQRGGRFVIIMYFVYLITFKHMFNRRIKMRRKTKFIFILVSVAALIVVLQLSKSRGTSDLFRSAYLYLCGCLPNMNQRLFTGAHIPLTLGGSSLYGFIAPVMYFFKGIGFSYPSFFLELTNIINVENIIDIGPADRYNAFVSVFYHLFLDGREFGVIIGTLLLGFISTRAYRKAKRTTNTRDYLVYGLLMYQLCSPMIRVQFSTYAYALSFYLFIAVNP